MNGSRGGALLGAALLLHVVSLAGHQEPQSPQPTFRARVNLVRVDVSVTGQDDQPVADLTAADFEILEDGIPQAVETVQFVRLDGTRSSDNAESLDIRSPEHAALEAARDDVRVFAIFFDDYHIDKSPYVTQAVRRALRALAEGFGPNDLIGMMDPLTPLSALEWTRSRNRLLERIEAFEGRRGEVFPVRSVMEEAQLRERNVWELRGGVTLSAMAALVTHLGGLREGRKSVIFVSQGPPLGPLGSSNYDRLREVVEAANRANVTIHVLDPRPLGGSQLGGSDAVQRMYAETGGRAIINMNDPEKRVGQIIADASAHYLVGYTPTRQPVDDGKFHKIEVRVKRRGMRVLARRGYFAATPEETSPDAMPRPVDVAITSALGEMGGPREGRPADVWIGASRAADAATRLTITWEPSERTAGRARPARLVVEQIEGGAPASRHELLPVSATAKTPEAAATLDVPQGSTVTLRFTAQSADGDVLDQWDHALRAPAFGGATLALGTPRFLRARSAFEKQAMASGQDPVPAAGRQFSRSDRVIVDVDLYADGGASVTAQLLNARGERLADLPAQQAGGRARVQLPLSSVAPSTYILRIEAKAGDAVARHHTAFRVGA